MWQKCIASLKLHLKSKEALFAQNAVCCYAENPSIEFNATFRQSLHLYRCLNPLINRRHIRIPTMTCMSLHRYRVSCTSMTLMSASWRRSEACHRREPFGRCSTSRTLYLQSSSAVFGCSQLPYPPHEPLFPPPPSAYLSEYISGHWRILYLCILMR